MTKSDKFVYDHSEFIFRYPGDKTDITGVTEEVWHYRYVGVEAATEIHERGICLEEYLEEKRMKQ